MKYPNHITKEGAETNEIGGTASQCKGTREGIEQGNGQNQTMVNDTHRLSVVRLNLNRVNQFSIVKLNFQLILKVF